MAYEGHLSAGSLNSTKWIVWNGKLISHSIGLLLHSLVPADQWGHHGFETKASNPIGANELM